jgi:hypothetical protein
VKSLLVLVLLAGTAAAAPPSETATVEPMVVHIKPAKRESTATVLTIAGIAAPFALTYLTYEKDTDNPMYAPIGMMTGIVLPAAGHWYTRRIGGYGMLVRLGAFMVGMVGLQYLDDADRCDRGEPVADGCFASDRTVGHVSLGVGAAMWAGSWVYDVWSARREVRRYNRRTTVQIMPMVSRDATGVTIGGAF